MATNHRRWNVAGDIQERVVDMVERGWTPAQIFKALGDDESLRRERPSQRTIQRMVVALELQGSSERWSLLASQPEEVNDVLKVLAAVIEVSAGSRTWLTTKEAAWAARIVEATPGLTAWGQYRLVRLYVRAEEQGTPTTGLDAFLAFEPWTDGECLSAYLGALVAGWVEPPFRLHEKAKLVQEFNDWMSRLTDVH